MTDHGLSLAPAGGLCFVLQAYTLVRPERMGTNYMTSWVSCM